MQNPYNKNEQSFWGRSQLTIQTYVSKSPTPQIELVNLTLSGSNNSWLSYTGQSVKTGMASVAHDFLFRMWSYVRSTLNTLHLHSSLSNLRIFHSSFINVA